MKKFIVILIIFLTFSIVYAQPRINSSQITNLCGTAIFNSDTGVTVNIGQTLADTNYKVFITPSADTLGTVGDFYVKERTTSNFVVYCTGSNTETNFDWLLIIK